jgi:hypothetical protein
VSDAFSVLELSRLTGHARSFVQKRIAGLKASGTRDGARVYPAKAALERIFGKPNGPADALTAARAKLYKARAQAMERRNRIEAEEVIELPILEEFLSAAIVNVRQRLMAIPRSAALAVAAEAGAPERIAAIEAILQRHVHEALEDLAAGDIVRRAARSGR